MSIKNFSKGSIAVYVTACLAVLFIFSLVFSPSLQNSITSKKQVGKVGHENINQQDFYMAYEQVKNQLLATNPGLNSKEGQLFIINQTWQYVHTRYSVQAMMNQFDFVMPQSMIEKNIKNEPTFQTNGVYDAKKFKAFLKQKDITVEHLVQIQSVDAMQDALFSITQTISKPIPSELKMLKTVASNQKQVSVKTLDIKSQKVPEPSDKDVKGYYDSHQIDFVQPNQFQFKYAVIDENAFSFDKQPSNEVLKKFYQDNLESYVKPEQVLMSITVLKPNAQANLTVTESNFIESFMGLNSALDVKINDIILHKGQGFEVITQEPSWRLVSQLTPELKTDSFLSKKQPIINIAEDGNIIIVENKAYKEESVPKFEMVISTVVQDYKKYIANEQFQSHMDELMELSYSGALKWSDLEHVMPGLKIQTTQLFEIDHLNETKPFMHFPKLIDWVKTHEDVKDITIKSTGPNKAVVIQQVQYIPKHLQTYPQVKDQIKQQLKDQAKLEKTQKLADDAVSQAKLKKSHASLNQSWHYFPKVTYAFNDLGYPNLIWIATLQKNQTDSVLKIDDLVTSNQAIFVIKWWDSKQGPLNDVFYKQLNTDWQDTLANDTLDALVSYYPLKKFIDV